MSDQLILALAIALPLGGLLIYVVQQWKKDRKELEIARDGRARAEAEAVAVRQATENAQKSFEALAAEALKSNSEAFLGLAKGKLEEATKDASHSFQKETEGVKKLVDPLQKALDKYEQQISTMEKDRLKAFGTIEEQLRETVKQSAEIARQAGGLKDALKRPNVRGRWGEVQLRNCIELAGMEDHCDVEFQETSLTQEEEMVRPDMLVRMPGGRKIAVDAKTPMEHFLSYIDAATDEERSAALIKHGRAVRAHVSMLSTRDYMQKIAESPDFVVMFLPNESFLAMALERESSMIEEALTKKVLITTPGTLIGLLKVVRYGWNEQKIALNAQQIADEGAKLNTEIARFLDEYAKLGKALKAATEAYENTTHRVEKQIVNSSARLTKLGAKSRKALSVAAVQMLGPGEDTDNELGEEEEQNAPIPNGSDIEGDYSLIELEVTP